MKKTSCLVLFLFLSALAIAQTKKAQPECPPTDAAEIAHLRAVVAQQAQALADAEKARQASEASVAVVNKAYLDLYKEYTDHLAKDAQIAAQITNQPQTPQQKGAKGYFANVLQGMSDAARAEAAKPTIHCTSNQYGDTVYTDCR